MSAPRRTNSFERSSQRRQQHDVEGRVNEHLAAAQVNHKERCGSDLQSTENLKTIVRSSLTSEPSAVRTALKETYPPELELLALLEGKSDSPSRATHPRDSQAATRRSEQLEAAGLHPADGAPTNGSLLEALNHAGGVSQQNIADWLESNDGARCVPRNTPRAGFAARRVSRRVLTRPVPPCAASTASGSPTTSLGGG